MELSGIKRNVNQCYWTGTVVKDIEIHKSRQLTARTRLKIAYDKHPTYVDIIGFNKTAETMQLICTKGSVVYVECMLSNETYTNKKGKIKAKMYFVVKDIDRLYVPQKSNLDEIDEKIEILDEIDPINCLYGDENE